MNYKRAAIEDLRDHSKRKDALQNMRDRIAGLNAALESSPAPGLDTVSVTGSKPLPDEKWINIITEKQELERNKAITQSLVDSVEQGLSSITQRQREILEKAYDPAKKVNWYIHAEELHIGKSRYYEEREEALRAFTIARYGIFGL